jgi:hypothetical protein
VHKKIKQPKEFRMEKVRLSSLLAFIIFLLVGCASSASSQVTEIREIVGTWKSDPPALAIRILPDGNVPAGVTAATIDENASIASWQYSFSFEEGILTIGNWLGCKESEIGTYEVFLLPNGNLDFNVVEDECEIRVNAFMGRRQGTVIDAEWIKVD